MCCSITENWELSIPCFEEYEEMFCGNCEKMKKRSIKTGENNEKIKPNPEGASREESQNG